jgi:antirestriction protein
MERQRPRHEEGEHHHEKHEFTPHERIELGITAAKAGDLVVDDHTARAIATQLRSIKTPMIDLFVQTGHVDDEAFKEIGLMRQSPGTTEQNIRWITWLGGYWLDIKHRHEQAGIEVPPGYDPRVYIADLDSLRRTIHHGLWVDANQTPADLNADVTAMLDSSPTVGATQWAVGATKDFGGLDLTGFRDLALISQLADGVVQHGSAYPAWVDVVGLSDIEQLDKFDDFYIGSYDSREAWMRHIADDLDWHGHLDRVVDPKLRPFLRVDYEAMAGSHLAESWDVALGHDRRIHVFLR